MTPTSSRKIIREANKAPASQLEGHIDPNEIETHQVAVLHASDLRDNQRESIWTIFESNMRALYTHSSFGWNPEMKKKELFHAASRFILVHRTAEMVAFTMFRFEYEDDWRLLYCYEFQVLASKQGLGIGKRLVEYLNDIGLGYSMEKIILTVFKENAGAVRFYQRLGFSTDSSSPNVEGDNEEVDYEILSKEITNS